MFAYAGGNEVKTKFLPACHVNILKMLTVFAGFDNENTHVGVLGKSTCDDAARSAAAGGRKICQMSRGTKAGYRGSMVSLSPANDKVISNVL